MGMFTSVRTKCPASQCARRRELVFTVLAVCTVCTVYIVLPFLLSPFHPSQLSVTKAVTPSPPDFIDPDLFFLPCKFLSGCLPISRAQRGEPLSTEKPPFASLARVTVFEAGEEGEEDFVLNPDACVPFQGPENRSLIICVYDRDVDLVVSSFLRDHGVWEKEQLDDMTVLLGATVTASEGKGKDGGGGGVRPLHVQDAANTYREIDGYRIEELVRNAAVSQGRMGQREMRENMGRYWGGGGVRPLLVQDATDSYRDIAGYKRSESVRNAADSQGGTGHRMELPSDAADSQRELETKRTGGMASLDSEELEAIGLGGLHVPDNENNQRKVETNNIGDLDVQETTNRYMAMKSNRLRIPGVRFSADSNKENEGKRARRTDIQDTEDNKEVSKTNLQGRLFVPDTRLKGIRGLDAADTKKRATVIDTVEKGYLRNVGEGDSEQQAMTKTGDGSSQGRLSRQGGFQALSSERKASFKTEGREAETAVEQDPEELTTVIDVGCNVGVYTLTAAALGHRVLAMDPVLSNLRLLHASLLRNNLTSRVTLLHNAVSHVPGRISILHSQGNVGGASVRLAESDAAPKQPKAAPKQSSSSPEQPNSAAKLSNPVHKHPGSAHERNNDASTRTNSVRSQPGYVSIELDPALRQTGAKFRGFDQSPKTLDLAPRQVDLVHDPDPTSLQPDPNRDPEVRQLNHAPRQAGHAFKQLGHAIKRPDQISKESDPAPRQPGFIPKQGGTQTETSLSKQSRWSSRQQSRAEAAQATDSDPNPDPSRSVWAVCLNQLVPWVHTQRVFLKLDVEGWEEKALRCAGDLFQQRNVRHVMMEWLFHRHSKAGAAVVQFMLRNGLLPFADATQGTPLDMEAYHTWPDNVLWIKR